jgi:hypothetical protein
MKMSSTVHIKQKKKSILYYDKMYFTIILIELSKIITKVKPVLI